MTETQVQLLSCSQDDRRELDRSETTESDSNQHRVDLHKIRTNLTRLPEKLTQETSLGI